MTSNILAVALSLYNSHIMDIRNYSVQFLGYIITGFCFFQ